MEQKKRNLESIFREGLGNYSEMPGKQVLKNIRFKLLTDDFFSLRYNKLNIAYTTIIIAGIIFFITSARNSNLPGTTNENSLKKEKKLTENKEKPNTTINNSMEEVPSKNRKDDLHIAAAIPAFKPSVKSGCSPLQVNFNNYSKYADSYIWNFSTGEISYKSEPSYVFKIPGTYKVELTATNKIGSNTKSVMITVYEKPKAICDIDVEKSSLHTKTVAFKNKSKNSDSFFWSFGDGKTSAEKNAVHTYKDFSSYRVICIAKNSYGCSDTTVFVNKFIEKNYLLSFPAAFRPNPLGRENNGYYSSAENDYFVFYPKNNGAKEYSLEIFARNGIKVFSTTDIKQGWNGYIKGRVAPSGDYTYRSSGVYPNGKKFNYTGIFRVITENYNDYY